MTVPGFGLMPLLGFPQNGVLTLPSFFALQSSGQLELAGISNTPNGEQLDLQGTINFNSNSPPSDGTYTVDNPIAITGVSLAIGSPVGPMYPSLT